MHSSESVYSSSNKHKSSSSTAGSEVQQRVLSARMLRVKSLQNQLTAAQQRIHDLEQDNRGLRTTLRRQERALLKYDSDNAGLPRLLASHQEEMRVSHERSKFLHKSMSELTVKLKNKDTQLLALTDQNKRLTQLNCEKNLEERALLSTKVKELKEALAERDKDLKLLSRKHQLETKSLRSQLQQAAKSFREAQTKLDAANVEITRLNLMELNNTRGSLMRYRGHNLRETHSAATTYRNNAHGHSYRDDVLYEDDREEDVDFQQKIIEYEAQKKLHLEQMLVSDPDHLDQPESADFYEMAKLKDIAEKELVLDAVCETVTRAEQLESCEQFKPPPPTASIDQRTMDPRNKTKLLAALKAIDAQESFDS